MPGVASKFSSLDCLRLLLILSQKPLSRVELVKKLGLGEGSVRSILNLFKTNTWVSSSRQGHVLSEEGSRMQGQINAHIKGPFSISCAIFKVPFCVGISVRKPDQAIDPVKLRDVALKWGAEAAMVLQMKGKNLEAPAVESELNLSPIQEALHPNDGDLVVVTFAESKIAAQTSALAVSLRADHWLHEFVKMKFGGERPDVPIP